MEKLNKLYSKKLIHLLKSISFYVMIFAWLAFTLSNLELKQSSDIANIFGQGFLSTQSDSMTGDKEDSFASGDLILVKMLDENTYQSLIIGDIVTYYDASIHTLNTHRIINIYSEEDILYLETQGDNSAIADAPIRASEAISVYNQKVQGLGTSLDYLQTPQGFALFVILPVLTILIYECLVLTKNLVNYNKIKFENSFESRYRDALESLELETTKIRQQVLSNWVSK